MAKNPRPRGTGRSASPQDHDNEIIAQALRDLSGAKRLLAMHLQLLDEAERSLKRLEQTTTSAT